MGQDRVLFWQEELLRIAKLQDLSPAARKAVYDVVADFMREDAEAVEELAA